MNQFLPYLIAQFDNYKPNENAGRAKTQVELKAELIRDNAIGLIFTLFISAQAIAQDIPLIEKTHDISRSAKKGYLGRVEAHPDKETFDMIFIAKGGSNNYIKTETYTFDKNLNQIGNTSEEIELEKARLKWRWFKYKGDLYKYYMASGAIDIKGNMTFRKKEITGR